MEKIKILNTELVAATQDELLEVLRQGVVVTPNIDHLVKLQYDKELYEFYRQTEWVICDSRLLYLFTKLLPKPLPQAIPGSGFFPAFAGWSLGLTLRHTALRTMRMRMRLSSG